MKLVQLHELADEPVAHNPEIRKRVMVRKGLVPHLTNFSQARFEPGQKTTRHAHRDMAEVYLVEAGAGAIVVDGVQHLLEAGCCVVVEPGEEHELAAFAAGLVVTYFGIEYQCGSPSGV